MILDEKSLNIIADSLGLLEHEKESFIYTHYEVISKYAYSKTLEFMVKEDPEVVKELNTLLEAKNKEDNKRGFYALHDQIKIYMKTYPDLEDEINKIVKEYEKDIFFEFLETGPEDGIMQLLGYFQKKLKEIPEKLEIIRIAKKRDLEDKVRQVLE